LTQLKAVFAAFPHDHAMTRLAALLSRLFSTPEWREIATAPFDREIELAVIGDRVGLVEGGRLRHGNGWLDAETLQPVAVTATHWRYRHMILPMSCC
jgi:hypothetical protein